MIAHDKKVTFDEVKNKIVYTLIQKNEGFAEVLPHVDYLDMTIIFYQSVGDNGYLPINYAYMKMLGVNEQDLLSVASENTPKLLGYKVRGVMSVIEECMGFDYTTDLEIHDGSIPIYVVSNKISYNGAAVLLYTGLMKAISNKLNCNLYIIPSSRHEILVVKDLGNGEIETDRLKELISYVNQTEVRPEDKLSDSLYYYDRETDKITIVE